MEKKKSPRKKRKSPSKPIVPANFLVEVPYEPGFKPRTREDETRDEANSLLGP